jgi:DNA-binding response OmpR family regulator
MEENDIHVLIAEDEKPIAKALQMKLQSNGFAVDIVENGEDAITKLSGKEYSVFLLDLMMPVMDGFAVLGEMQQRGLKTPVIVSSNLSQEDDILKAKELGATDYYVKSNTSISEVVQILEKIVNS